MLTLHHRALLNIFVSQNAGICNGVVQAGQTQTFHVVNMIDMEKVAVLF